MTHPRDTGLESTIAETLGAYFTGTDFVGDDTLPGQMSLYALDTLAMALGGASCDSSVVARQAVHSGSGSATVFGADMSAAPAEAALLNGIAAHGLELDDDHRTSVMHPGAVVVPAAFALAEAKGVSGRTFLRATLAGYEVAIRTGEAYAGKLYANGFHPTAVCGVFGAAAACSTVLGLNKAGFVRAMGIAGTQAAGLMEWRSDGSWIKRLHPGRSAQSGLIAAQLAQAGFTGPSTVFEGEFGVFKALGHGRSVRGSALTDGLGRSFLSFGTAIKPYPCCRFAHGAIDLAVETHARLKGLAPDRVTVRLFRTDVLTYHSRTTNDVDAQFNIPYLVAVALLSGEVGLSDFSDEAITRANVLQLAARISVIEVPEFSSLYPETYITELDVESKADSFVLRSDCPSGDPEAQPYRSDPDRLRRETIAKTLRILDECGHGQQAKSLVDAVFSLNEAPDVSRVATLLAQRPMPPK